jgi:hypothetical protein
MNRSPLFYPLSRGGSAGGDGAADLQADVMRFMAIISLCLVAIFALVKSMPLTPAALDPVPEKPAPVEEVVEVKKPAPVEVVEVVEVVEKVEKSAPVEVVEEGFTLRFETDAALMSLVARQLVGLYAIAPDKAQRMNVEGDAISFWPASVPAQFHEMDQATVPGAVLAAFRTDDASSDIKWGVTLPANMSRELNSYLASERGGSLTIGRSGQIVHRQ